MLMLLRPAPDELFVFPAPMRPIYTEPLADDSAFSRYLPGETRCTKNIAARLLSRSVPEVDGTAVGATSASLFASIKPEFPSSDLDLCSHRRCALGKRNFGRGGVFRAARFERFPSALAPKPAEAGVFHRIVRHLSLPLPARHRTCSVPCSGYPAGDGSAAILSSIRAKSRRVRWLSASSNQ